MVTQKTGLFMTVSQKMLTLHSRDNFAKCRPFFFVVKLGSKFVVKLLLKTSPHLKCITTMPGRMVEYLTLF